MRFVEVEERKWREFWGRGLTRMRENGEGAESVLFLCYMVKRVGVFKGV